MALCPKNARSSLHLIKILKKLQHMYIHKYLYELYDYDYDYEMLLLRHKEIQYNMS